MLNVNKLLTKIQSWLIGMIDYSYLLITLYKGSKRPKYYRLGWGNLKEYRRVLKECMKSFEEADVPFDLHSKLEWEKKIEIDGVQVTNGKFLSPLAKFLPKESSLCNVSLISPLPLEQSGSPTVYVVMLPATGEQCYTKRFEMASLLARERGYSSIIVCAPYYGLRRPLQQQEDYHDTVVDYLLMNISIMQEAALVVRHFSDKDPHALCAITGFSWGGAMAATTSCIAAQWGVDYRKLACVPYAGAASPSGMVDGILDCTIAW